MPRGVFSQFFYFFFRKSFFLSFSLVPFFCLFPVFSFLFISFFCCVVSVVVFGCDLLVCLSSDGKAVLVQQQKQWSMDVVILGSFFFCCLPSFLSSFPLSFLPAYRLSWLELWRGACLWSCMVSFVFYGVFWCVLGAGEFVPFQFIFICFCLFSFLAPVVVFFLFSFFFRVCGAFSPLTP